MPSVHENLYQATFRGVPFLFTSTQRKGGRKTAIHEYPNAERRFVEDLGKIVPTFSMDATIFGVGEDYFQKRDRFIDALEDVGWGQLSHPFYGNVDVSVIGYTVSESITEMGKASFSIEFAVTDHFDTLPSATASDGSLIQLKAQKLAQALTNKLSNTYDPTKLSRQNHTFNLGIFNQILGSLNQGVRVIQSLSQAVQPNINPANTQINYMSSRSNVIVSDADLLSESISDGLDEVAAIESEPETLYLSFRSMFRFRDGESLPAATTIQRQKMLEFHYLMTYVYNMLVLLYAYEQAVNIEYFTAQDVEDVRSVLEDQYTYILSLDNVDYDLLELLTEVRTDMRAFFNDVGKQVYRLVSISTHQIPVSVLTYQYYGSLDIENEIIQINGITEPSFVEGTINILAD